MPLRSLRFRAAGPAVRALTILAVFGAGLMPTVAQGTEPGIRVGAAWIRMIIPSRPAAGYFTLSNAGDQPRQLVGATSPGCGMLMLHRSVSTGGVEQMDMVPSIAVPPHGSVSFVPGGYHLMCMSPAASLKPGSSASVTLNFADGGSVIADFAVRGALGK